MEFCFPNITEITNGIVLSMIGQKADVKVTFTSSKCGSTMKPWMESLCMQHSKVDVYWNMKSDWMDIWPLFPLRLVDRRKFAPNSFSLVARVPRESLIV